jgi:hypothetical protein
MTGDSTLLQLKALTGQDVTVRFASASLSGHLTAVDVMDWGYMLHVVSPIGEHFIPYPGQVLHLVAGRRE